MENLYMKQKIISLRGRFTVVDAEQQERYFVEGTFLQIPKRFSIYTGAREEVATITKKTFSWLPTFFVEMEGREVLTIKKDFTFFKASYSIDAAGMEVTGNWWDMNFTVLRKGHVIGNVQKKWLSWGDSYEIQVHDESCEKILIALVVAIDCVKADQAAAANAAT